MDMMTAQPTMKFGPLTRFILYIAGVDEAKLRQCPQDWDNVYAVAQLMICTYIYQTALFSLISNELFSAPGQIRPELLAASAFLATFLLTIDGYVIVRSGWHREGLQELARGGLNLQGGVIVRLKAGIFLAIRILFSICLAQLTVIFLAILIFSPDIGERLQGKYLHTNAVLIGSATELVDGEIQRQSDAVKMETVQDDALAAQVTALRQNQIDPSAGSAQVQFAQQEVTQLLTRKATADQAVQQDETSASNELGGIKSPDSSGIPGDGPRRRAALEAVGNAKEQDQQISVELDAAQKRLDELRAQSLATSQPTERLAHAELPSFQNTLGVEDTKLASMKSALAALEGHRDEAIRAAVEAAPNYVAYDKGLLAQITALDQIAHENPKIAVVIILVDITSFGFELAAVLAKVLSYCPTEYSALLASSNYMRVVRMVDEMMEELNASSAKSGPELYGMQPIAQLDENDSPRQAATDPFSSLKGSLPSPPKRGRGRPRKVPPKA
jgi:hypothetical protein